MKRPVLLFAASAAAACCLLASCGSRSPEQPEPASGSAAPEGAQTAADSERAMDNFLAKVGAGNYVMRAENYLTTSVYSPDQVLFTYADEAYDDYAVMSVDQEAFEAPLWEKRNMRARDKLSTRRRSGFSITGWTRRCPRAISGISSITCRRSL